MSGLVIDIRDQYAIQNHLVTFVKRSVIISVAHVVSSGCGLWRRLPELMAAADRLRSRLLS
jgi:hypothetical protein